MRTTPLSIAWAELVRDITQGVREGFHVDVDFRQAPRKQALRANHRAAQHRMDRLLHHGLERDMGGRAIRVPRNGTQLLEDIPRPLQRTLDFGEPDRDGILRPVEILGDAETAHRPGDDLVEIVRHPLDNTVGRVLGRGERHRVVESFLLSDVVRHENHGIDVPGRIADRYHARLEIEPAAVPALHAELDLLRVAALDRLIEGRLGAHLVLGIDFAQDMRAPELLGRIAEKIAVGGIVPDPVAVSVHGGDQVGNIFRHDLEKAALAVPTFFGLRPLVDALARLL